MNKARSDELLCICLHTTGRIVAEPDSGERGLTWWARDLEYEHAIIPTVFSPAPYPPVGERNFWSIIVDQRWIHGQGGLSDVSPVLRAVVTNE